MRDILGVAVGGGFCGLESLWDPRTTEFLFKLSFFLMWGTLIPSRGVPFAYPHGEKILNARNRKPNQTVALFPVDRRRAGGNKADRNASVSEI